MPGKERGLGRRLRYNDPESLANAGEKNRRLIYNRRKECIKKKTTELKTLSNVDGFTVIFGLDGEIESCPKDPREVKALLKKFMNYSKEESNRKNLSNVEVLDERKIMIMDDEEEDELAKGFRQCRDDSVFQGLSMDSMKDFLSRVQCKIEDVTKRVNQLTINGSITDKTVLVSQETTGGGIPQFPARYGIESYSSDISEFSSCHSLETSRGDIPQLLSACLERFEYDIPQLPAACCGLESFGCDIPQFQAPCWIDNDIPQICAPNRPESSSSDIPQFQAPCIDNAGCHIVQVPTSYCNGSCNSHMMPQFPELNWIDSPGLQFPSPNWINDFYCYDPQFPEPILVDTFSNNIPQLPTVCSNIIGGDTSQVWTPGSINEPQIQSAMSDLQFPEQITGDDVAITKASQFEMSSSQSPVDYWMSSDNFNDWTMEIKCQESFENFCDLWS